MEDNESSARETAARQPSVCHCECIYEVLSERNDEARTENESHHDGVGHISSAWNTDVRVMDVTNALVFILSGTIR